MIIKREKNKRQAKGGRNFYRAEKEIYGHCTFCDNIYCIIAVFKIPSIFWDNTNKYQKAKARKQICSIQTFAYCFTNLEIEMWSCSKLFDWIWLVDLSKSIHERKSGQKDQVGILAWFYFG